MSFYLSNVFNHNSTGVTSGVTLIKKIELKIEQNMDKTDYRTQNRVNKRHYKIQEV